ncbi:hypothetical protein RJ639_043088 [Escallonia herrerae]|uniref:Glutathione peroxidase n=1 Tax=Escallonia herrerae TaxID=1293975 RepID=A0AA88WAS5_9ASTE|nr:hypothetical protein RJ639_043088 [Escallonia herrerae]
MGGSASVPQKSIHEFTVKGSFCEVCRITRIRTWTSASIEAKSFSLSMLLPNDFEILAFPCNQFLKQEPGTDQEAHEFACTRYKAEYPIFKKIRCNGADAAPIYKFLKASKGGYFGPSIKWNFTKFLVDKEGQVIRRYGTSTAPLAIEVAPSLTSLSIAYMREACQSPVVFEITHNLLLLPVSDAGGHPESIRTSLRCKWFVYEVLMLPRTDGVRGRWIWVIGLFFRGVLLYGLDYDSRHCLLVRKEEGTPLCCWVKGGLSGYLDCYGRFQMHQTVDTPEPEPEPEPDPERLQRLRQLVQHHKEFLLRWIQMYRSGIKEFLWHCCCPVHDN